MEYNNDKYMGIVGVPMYGLMFWEYFRSIDDILKSNNAVQKSVWLYNNEVWKNKKLQDDKQGSQTFSNSHQSLTRKEKP